MTFVLDPSTTQGQMQGFDVIVAVTENNINANLKFLTGEDDGIEDRIDIKIEREDARLRAEIDPPKVRLRVAGEPHNVIFIVTLKSGTFDYWTGHGPSSKPQSVPIDNWVVGFKVKLDLADVSKLPPAVAAQVKNLGAGMFSVRQLFMDFQNANLTEWDESSTQLPGALQTDPSLKAYLLTCLTQYLQQLRNSGGNILGYAIRVTNPNEVAPEHPSLPPTDLTFVTNQFMPDGKTPSPDSRLDTLAFSMMTQHRPFPANRKPWSGNWVSAEEVYGTIAISRESFLNGYLLPTLANCTNLQTQMAVNGRTVAFAFWPGGEFTATEDGGTFASSDAPVVIPGFEGIGDTLPSDRNWSARHTCTVKVAPNSNVISVSGHSEVNFQATVWIGIKYAPVTLTEEVWQKAEVDWSATITLDSVQDGGLNVKVAVTALDCRTSDGGNWASYLEKAFNPDLARHGKNIEDRLRQMVNTNDLAKRLQHALTLQSQFVFPGGQQFTMYDATFNSQRDLVAKVKYNFY